jgi:hypothetical protein
MVSAKFYAESGVLVVTCNAFGAGHLFSDSGQNQWWFKTWAVKGGVDEIEAMWREMGEGKTPIPCLLFVNRITLPYTSPSPLPEFRWIHEEVAKHGGVHIPAEVVRVSWIDPTVDDVKYPWRLRVTAAGPFRFTDTLPQTVPPPV